MDKTAKSVFVCQECGKESVKWLGRCPECESWNTFVETRVSSHKNSRSQPIDSMPVCELSSVALDKAARIVLPCGEFNRVLGGGIVPGSLILISGDPGIGKSTLLLQISSLMAQQNGKVLYVSGEESVQQARLRADRLNISGDGLFLLPETDLDAILKRMEEIGPAMGVIDSIQTVYLRDLDGPPGSVSQVRGCTLRLMEWAKPRSIPLLIIGHVTKEGAVAGPKALEHIVDVVLYLEGESFSTYRLLRGVKNRFGSTNEIGIFEMRDRGLVEVENPSQVFMSRGSQRAVGSVIASILEGTRPLLVEIQGLTSTTSFGLPRRTANGVDFNRLMLIVAVLNKRAGLKMGNQDIIVNVVGGLRTSEPATDLAVALSIASSFMDKEVNPATIVVGELGLSGEIRGVPQLERRLAEGARQGFKQCICPGTSLKGVSIPEGMRVLAVGSIRESIQLALSSS